jgi:hypothetical protein
MPTILTLIIAGAVGALVKDILQDGYLEMPKFQDSKIVLGSIGGLIVGAAIGWLVDKTATTAFLGGYVGKAVIEKILSAFEGVK